MKTENPADVLAMIVDGGKLTAIADTTGWHKGEVVALAREHGYALNVSSDRFQPAPQSKPKPQGIVRPQTGTGAVPEPTAKESTAAPVSPIRPAHRDLIEEGKQHSSLRVQRAAIKAEVALKALAGMVESTRLEEAAKRAAEKAKAEARAEVERLERQLAEAKAKLRGPARAAAVAVVAPNQAGASAKEIRAWAASAGVDCPATGRVPGAVVDAYLAAHQDGAA